MKVYFYRVSDPYGELSNFAQFGFDLDGKFWKTSEHYFQAQKFSGTTYEEKVRLASSAGEAAKLGRGTRFPLRPDWEQVKVEVMRKALYHKFASHPGLADLLISTGEDEIVERTTSDYYWGCGSDGSGLNMLGKLLMELRSRLRSG